MPRRSRPARPRTRATVGDDDERPIGAAGWQSRRSTADGDFLVRSVPGAASVKTYRCPSCQQLIPPGAAHLVVWPAWTGEEQAGLERRRHWHTGCWERRAARGGAGALHW